jgi:hypothetical protein
MHPAIEHHAVKIVYFVDFMKHIRKARRALWAQHDRRWRISNMSSWNMKNSRNTTRWLYQQPQQRPRYSCGIICKETSCSMSVISAASSLPEKDKMTCRFQSRMPAFDKTSDFVTAKNWLFIKTHTVHLLLKYQTIFSKQPEHLGRTQWSVFSSPQRRHYL